MMNPFSWSREHQLALIVAAFVGAALAITGLAVLDDRFIPFTRRESSKDVDQDGSADAS